MPVMSSANGAGAKRLIARGLRLFRPILPGATLRDRLIACVGALLGIALTGLISGWVFGDGPHIPLIVAPMGASAVLLFAVPASPLAQPWSIIGGNTLSAFVGVTAAYFIHDPVIAIGVGVSLAIALMSLTRCLHPPGGAAALTALIGGPAVASAGFLFPLVPVCLNSMILVGLGVAFHRLARRQYPHSVAPTGNAHGTMDRPPPTRIGFSMGDVDGALATLQETFDIDRADLDRLLREVERQALTRAHSQVVCETVMSRDVVTIGVHEPTRRARELLLAHNIRTLPVVDDRGCLLGTVGLRELSLRGETELVDAMSPARTAAPDIPVVSLVPKLTDGHAHAVVVVGSDRRIVGIITQTEITVTLARLALVEVLLRPPLSSA